MSTALFLFNHDAPHQVAHLAGVAAAFARAYPQHRTLVAYATPAIRRTIERLLPPNALDDAQWHELSLPAWSRLTAPLDQVLPASRLLRLRQHTGLFASADAVISTERTCLHAKRFIAPADMPRFIRIPHGAGDRKVTYHPDYKRFDLILLAGQKAVDQLAAMGVARDRLRITGYPKFDTVDVSARRRFFGTDRPTFVYNPHFDPHLSSWYDAGPALLEWFASAEGQQFNCIFAPHVMLFRKRLHMSPEYRVARVRPGIPAVARAADNILIDLASPRLFDMSYMLGADAYIGDASSQVYEFLLRPRSVFILDARGALQAEKETLPFLQAGPRCGSVGALTQALTSWRNISGQYSAAQRALFDLTFAPSDKPSSQRAAEAIAQALREWES